MTHKEFINKIKLLLNNEAQGMVEYILILGLIALAVIASLTPVGKTLTDKLTEFAVKISNS